MANWTRWDEAGAPGEWIVGRSAAPGIRIEDASASGGPEGAIVQPDIVMVLDGASGRIVAGDVIEPGAPHAAVVAFVEGLIAEADSETPPPSHVRVEDPALAEALRAGLLGIGPAGRGSPIAVVCAPTPEMAAPIEAMRDYLAQRQATPGYLDGGAEEGMAPAIVGAMFERAAHLVLAEPWEIASDTQLFRVDVPELGVSGACALIIGALDESLGLLIFDSLERYREFHALAEKLSEDDHEHDDDQDQDHDHDHDHAHAHDHDEEPPVVAGLLALDFVSDEELSPRQRSELAEAGWTVSGEDAYPQLTRRDDQGEVKRASVRDVRLAGACAEAVARFSDDNPDFFEETNPSPIAWRLDAGDALGPLTVMLTVPFPSSEWLPASASLDEEELARRDAEAMLDGFLTDSQEAGRAEEWLATADFVGGSLFAFVVDAGCHPKELDKSLVEEYLLDFFPREVAANDDVVGRTIDVLVALIEWMGENEAIEEDAKALSRVVAKNRKAFLREALNPDNYGPAKSTATALLERGIDPSDKEAVERYRAEKSSLVGGVSDRPLPRIVSVDSAAPPTRAPSETRWRPTPGQPLPALDGPCPCGSGKRYKKCCMPR